MAFFRIFPVKDTFIANGDGLLDTSASNMGASEILNLYAQISPLATSTYDVSGNLVSSSIASNFSHILTQFDLTQFPSSALADPDGVQFRLRMFDAQHAETIPSEFSVIVSQASQSWSEGTGHDLDTYTDLGYANWSSASVSAAWMSPGGDVQPFDPELSQPFPVPLFESLSASFDFQSGHEDLDLDVTDIVYDWISNGENHGFFIKIDPALSSTDHYIKKFHSRHSHFPTKIPYLQACWDDTSFSLSTSSYFLVTSGPWSGSYLDPRLSSTMTGTTVLVYNSQVDPTSTLIFSLYGIKDVFVSTMRDVFSTVETANFRLHSRPKDWNPATVTQNPSVTSGTVLTKAYYRIVNDSTEEILVPFGTGTTQSTRLSYDDEGNFFKIYMSSLPTATLLRLDFQYEVSGSTVFVPGDEFTFRIR